jgi:hypothetical protein
MDGTLYMETFPRGAGPRIFYRGEYSHGIDALAIAKGAGLVVGEQFRSLAFWLGAEADPE